MIHSRETWELIARASMETIATTTVPEDRSGHLKAVAIACLATALVGLVLRFYVRTFIIKKVASDDWLMLLTLGFFAVYLGFVFTGIKYGTGRHRWDLTPDDYSRAMRAWYCCEWAFALTTTSVKVFFGVFYLRIVTVKWQRVMLKGMMATCVGFGIVYFFCIVFQCAPISFFWMRHNGGHGTCLLDEFMLWGSYAHSILSSIVDWIIGLFPIVILRGVQMDWRTKLSVIVLLGLGSLASVSTLVRMAYLYKIMDTNDFLWNTTDIAIWATVEPGIALLSGGLAVCRPILRMVIGQYKAFDIHSRRYKASKDGYSPERGYSLDKPTKSAHRTKNSTHVTTTDLGVVDKAFSNPQGYNTTTIWVEDDHDQGDGTGIGSGSGGRGKRKHNKADGDRDDERSNSNDETPGINVSTSWRIEENELSVDGDDDDEKPLRRHQSDLRDQRDRHERMRSTTDIASEESTGCGQGSHMR